MYTEVDAGRIGFAGGLLTVTAGVCGVRGRFRWSCQSVLHVDGTQLLRGEILNLEANKYYVCISNLSLLHCYKSVNITSGAGC